MNSILNTIVHIELRLLMVLATFIYIPSNFYSDDAVAIESAKFKNPRPGKVQGWGSE